MDGHIKLTKTGCNWSMSKECLLVILRIDLNMRQAYGQPLCTEVNMPKKTSSSVIGFHPPPICSWHFHWVIVILLWSSAPYRIPSTTGWFNRASHNGLWESSLPEVISITWPPKKNQPTGGTLMSSFFHIDCLRIRAVIGSDGRRIPPSWWRATKLPHSCDTRACCSAPQRVDTSRWTPAPGRPLGWPTSADSFASPRTSSWLINRWDAMGLSKMVIQWDKRMKLMVFFYQSHTV